MGDAALWKGIKRAGNALIMGQFAASNILKLLHWQQLQREYQPMDLQDSWVQEDLLECPDFEPMMALSIGDEAVAYTKASGVTWGKNVKDQIIGRGLGIDREYCIMDTHLEFLLIPSGCSEYLRFEPNGTRQEELP